MDRIEAVQRLCRQIEEEFDEYTSKELQEVHESVDRAIAEDLHLNQDKHKLDSLRAEIESLKSLKAKKMEDLQAVNDEDEELSHRLKLQKNELVDLEKANKEKEESLKSLMMEVVEMERDKENRFEKVRKDFDCTMKLWKIYKAYLDIQITFVKPDLYLIGFSASKNTPSALTLRSLPDLKDWEVIEVSGKPEFKNELISYLVETKDILGVICKARHHFYNTAT